jgi:hypothetical protein
MVAYNFEDIEDPAGKFNELTNKIVRAEQYQRNIKDPRMKEGAGRKIQEYQAEQDALKEYIDSRQAPAPTTTGPSEAARAYNIEEDPIYQQYMQRAQSQFNQARAGALGSLQYQEEGIERALDERERTSERARRRLAGNFAARGMGGGARGAYYQAQDQANAAELARRTDLREQLSELNRQFVANYGAPGTDWLGTIQGQEIREDAIQSALGALIPRYTSVG